MKKTPLVLALLLTASTLMMKGQNVAINTTGALPNASAILDLSNSSSMAFLPPQVALTNINTLAPVPAPGPAGLVVYSTTAPVGGGGIGLYFWDGAKWNYLSTGAASTGWAVTGNAGTNPAINFAGTSDPQPFIVKTQGVERMRFLAGGGAGIGTATPLSGVDVNGSMGIGTYAGTVAAPANGVIISGKVGIGNSAPAANAILDLTNTVSPKGFMPPPMTTAQRNALVGPTGLIIFNTTTNCIEYYNGVTWQQIACQACTAPPATPGVITGTITPQISSTYTYTIASVAGASSYTWAVSGVGNSIASGQGTTSAGISFGATVGTYTITVVANNACGSSAASSLVVNTTNCLHGTISFAYSGATQPWTVPPCITSITITVKGGSGAANIGNTSTGGLGGTSVGTLTVVGGQVLQVNVGGAGSGTAGGWNGGGAGGLYGACAGGSVNQYGGGGGGETDVRVAPYAIVNAVIVAGGGGGGGGDRIVGQGPGAGGGGGAGWYGGGGGGAYQGGAGGGGTQIAGGAAGATGFVGYACEIASTPGTQGIGGVGAYTTTNGQGGTNTGGNAGGAGGGVTGTAGTATLVNWQGGGGGGGSSYIGGVTAATTTSASNAGNGSCTIVY